MLAVGEYRWDPGSAPQSVPAPDWLIALAKRKIKAWARAALEYECKAVASAQPGTRNATLNTAAFNLFQIVAGGELDEDGVRDALLEAAVTCRLIADDGMASVEATINSGAQAGIQQPRTRPQPRVRSGPRPTIKIIGGQLPRIINETEDALVASGLPIFSRASSLVEPVSETMLAAGERKTVVAQGSTARSRFRTVDGVGARVASYCAYASHPRTRARDGQELSRRCLRRHCHRPPLSRHHGVAEYGRDREAPRISDPEWPGNHLA
jgi:hypothetical protein